MNNLPEIQDKIPNDIFLAMAEIQQPRSRFQIEKFVLNQHDTEETQYVQCLNEIQSLYYTIKSVTLDMKINEIKIQRLRETKDEIDELEAQKLELGLEQTRLVGIGAFRELDHFVEIWNQFPVKYTRAEIEEKQPEYWNKRLVRQATAQAIGQGSVDWAQIDALNQIGALEGFSKSNIENKINKEIEQ